MSREMENGLSVGSQSIPCEGFSGARCRQVYANIWRCASEASSSSSSKLMRSEAPRAATRGILAKASDSVPPSILVCKNRFNSEITFITRDMDVFF